MDTNELNKILLPNEKIIWQNTPRFLPFIVGQTFVSVIAGLFLLIFMSNLVFFLLSNDVPPFYTLLFSPLILLTFFMLCFPITYNLLVYGRTIYAISDQRVIIQSGVIGRDFYAAPLKTISNVSVRVGLFDKLFLQNTGSIYISTAGTFIATNRGAMPAAYVFFNIPNPYEVFNIINVNR